MAYDTQNPLPSKYLLSFDYLFTSDELKLIVQNSTVVRCNKGDVIFKQGMRTSHLMFLRSGLVKIYKESKSKVMILKLTTPNNFMGLLSMFGQDTYQYSAAAVDLSEVVIIDIQAIKTLVDQNNKFASELLKITSRDGLFIFEKLMNFYQKQLPGRIADVILYFAEEIYHNYSFTFPLARRELAELAGTTKESFIRTLTEFKNDLIIELDGKKVDVKSLKILQKLSQIG